MSQEHCYLRIVKDRAVAHENGFSIMARWLAGSRSSTAHVRALRAVSGSRIEIVGPFCRASCGESHTTSILGPVLLGLLLACVNGHRQPSRQQRADVLAREER